MLKNANDFPITKPQHYFGIYEKILKDNSTILEIGVRRGTSLRYWADKFPNSKIIGIDKDYWEDVLRSKSHIRTPTADELLPMPENVHFYKCDQTDVPALEKIAIEHGPFDFIIDDGSHKPEPTFISLKALFSSLKSDGYYIIEDWACYTEASSMFESNNLQPLENYDLISNILNELAIWKGTQCRAFGDSVFQSIQFFENILIIHKKR